jgi:hypothetical protein
MSTTSNFRTALRDVRGQSLIGPNVIPLIFKLLRIVSFVILFLTIL